jgi:hypothetical protein
MFDAKVGQREQERIFVGRDERAFGQQALEVAQELDLLLRAGHEFRYQYLALPGMI